VDIKERLEQNKADRKRLEEEGQRLEAELKKSLEEKTYPCGSIFEIEDSGDVLLSSVSVHLVLIYLDSGNYWSYPDKTSNWSQDSVPFSTIEKLANSSGEGRAVTYLGTYADLTR